MNEVGSGYKVINYPTIENHDSDDPEEWYLDVIPEVEIEINKILDIIKRDRGEVISRCVDIDNLLGRVISDFFFKDKPQKREIFHELFLETTILSFSQKKKILKSIVENYPDNDEISSDMLMRRRENNKKLFEDLNCIIKMRNALAHGSITFDFEKSIATLQYYDSNRNEKMETLITPQFFEEFRLKIDGIVFHLWSMQHHTTIVSESEDI